MIFNIGVFLIYFVLIIEISFDSWDRDSLLLIIPLDTLFEHWIEVCSFEILINPLTIENEACFEYSITFINLVKAIKIKADIYLLFFLSIFSATLATIYYLC